MNEVIWKDFPGYEEYFMVSSDGDIWSKRRKRLVKTPVNKYRGYKEFCTAFNKVNKTFQVHQVVAKTFLGEPKEGQMVRHLNGDRTDNRLENLTYGTMLENMQDRREEGYKGPRLLSEKDIKWAQDRILAGWSVERCANELGVGYSAVKKHIDFNIKEVRNEMLWKAIQTGATVNTIGRAFGTGHNTICSLLKTYFKPMRQLRKEYPLNKNITPAELRIIMGLEK